MDRCRKEASMANTGRGCVTNDALGAYLEGRVSLEDVEQLEKHLETCSGCATRASAEVDRDPICRAARAAGQCLEVLRESLATVAPLEAKLKALLHTHAPEDHSDLQAD